MDDEKFWEIISMLDWDFENRENPDKAFEALDTLYDNNYIDKSEYEETKERLEGIFEEIEDMASEYEMNKDEDEDYDEDDDYDDIEKVTNFAEWLEYYGIDEELWLPRTVHHTLNEIYDNGLEIDDVYIDDDNNVAYIELMPNSKSYRKVTDKPIGIYFHIEDLDDEDNGIQWDYSDEIFYRSNSLDDFMYRLQHSPEQDKLFYAIEDIIWTIADKVRKKLN